MWASDVLALLLSGDMQLWAALDGQSVKAVCTTQIVTYPRMKVCRLAHCAGVEMSQWIRGLDLIRAWAKAHGCQEIWGGGRKGWARSLGWEPIYFICGEEL